jgi:rRNA maturation RNase YbeY
MRVAVISNKIKFHFIESCTLRDRNKLKSFLLNLFSKEGKKLASVNYIFCSDHYLLKINKKYLNHQYYTDILTFVLSASQQPIVADIYISVHRVKENARDLKLPNKTELLRVIFHGALHICGYNDKTDRQTKIMRQKENECIDKFGKFHVKQF